MTESQKFILIALLAYMIDNHDIPSQISGEDLNWQVTGNNDDLDEANFSIAVSSMGTVYISNDGDGYTAKVGTDEVTVRGIMGSVRSANSFGLDQAYDFDVSTSHVSFKMDGYHQFDARR